MKLLRNSAFWAVAAGGIGGVFGTISVWATAQTLLSVALSVVAGAVLVRLARGLPIADTGYLTLDDAHRLTTAFRKISQRLRALTFVILLALVLNIFGPSGSVLIEKFVPYSCAVLIGVFSGILGYIGSRVIAIVNADVDLVDLQSELFVQNIAKSSAGNFETKSMSGRPLQGPSREEFGSIVPR